MSGTLNKNSAEVPQKTAALSTATQVTCSQPTWNSFSETNRFSSIRPYLYIESQEYRSNRVFQSIRLSYLLGRIPNIFIGTPVRDKSTRVHKFLKTFSYDHILLMQSKLIMVTLFQLRIQDGRCHVGMLC